MILLSLLSDPLRDQSGKYLSSGIPNLLIFRWGCKSQDASDDDVYGEHLGRR